MQCVKNSNVQKTVLRIVYIDNTRTHSIQCASENNKIYNHKQIKYLSILFIL